MTNKIPEYDGQEPMVPMLRSDEIGIAEAAHRLGVCPRTAKKYVSQYSISRRLGRINQIWVSAPAVECVRHSDFEALELLRNGVRDHPRLHRYFKLAGVPL